jgi:hypothetical protein
MAAKKFHFNFLTDLLGEKRQNPALFKNSYMQTDTEKTKFKRPRFSSEGKGGAYRIFIRVLKLRTFLNISCIILILFLQRFIMFTMKINPLVLFSPKIYIHEMLV